MEKEKPEWYKNKLLYNKEYHRNIMKQIKFELNKNTDKEIIDHLDTINNKSKYLKDLIIADMKNKKSTL